MDEPEWETIQTTRDPEAGNFVEETARLRVPGGWLYRYAAQDSKDRWTYCLVFVPMPNARA